MTQSLANAPVSSQVQPDVVADYVAAEYLWREAHGSTAAGVNRDAVACEYVRAIDAYVTTLKACGRRIPYRLDEVATALRATWAVLT
jgi:hypothetical protein